MGKKYRHLKKKGNVIVFPQAIERLLAEGMKLLKNEQYGAAKDRFEQVLSFEPEDAAALGAYAYSLFELEQFEEALHACRQLLKVGPIHYLETMELYISILMQLRHYKEAEETIEALIDEGVLPPDRLEQFEQLRSLNERIMANAAVQQADPGPYEAERFIRLSPAEQETLILELPPALYASVKPQLVAVVNHPEADILTKTYILFMLHQEKIEAEVTVRKFHYEGSFNTLELPDPLGSERLNAVKAFLTEAFDKDPSRLEMALELFERHVYLIYPFQFDEFEPEEIAHAYVSFLDRLFSGEMVPDEEGSLSALISRAELWFEGRGN